MLNFKILPKFKSGLNELEFKTKNFDKVKNRINNVNYLINSI